MLKKVSFLTVILYFSVLFFMTSYAINTNEKAEDKKNKGKLINITKPKKYEIILGRKYVLCGITNYKNLRMRLMIYNEKDEKYVKKDEFHIETPGIVLKQVDLPKYGINKIKIVTYYDNNNKEKQIENFVITTLDKNMKNILKSGSRSILDSMWYIR
jgi:hypothetical protein